MGLASLYYLHGIYLPSGALLSELTDCSPSVNTEMLTGMASGHPHPLFRGVRNQKPDASFTCHAVKQILDAVIAGGNNYALDLSAGNTDLLYKQGQHLGFRYAAASSVHARLRCAQAMLLWETISATHQQDASIACKLVAAYDGSNNPVVPAGTVALTGTPAATQFFTLGPVSINGTALHDEQSVSLASGVAVEEAGASGETWNTYTGCKNTDPVLTVTALGEPWDLRGLAGAAATSVVFYLRAKTDDGHNVADATASHIKITASKGIILPEQVSGGGNDPTTTTLRIAIRASDADTDPLTIDTAAAIT